MEGAVSTELHHATGNRTSFSKDLNKSFGFNLAEKSISKQMETGAIGYQHVHVQKHH